MNVNEYVDFSYLGSIQNYTIENSGIYKLEVWGASGGDYQSGKGGGRGGYAKGYIKLKSNTTIYIGVGGAGSGINSGFNGGGYGYYDDDPNTLWDIGLTIYTRRGGGGGASHIALASGTLPNLTPNQDKVLIIAGGGGGTQHRWNQNGEYNNIAGVAGGTTTYNNSTFGQGSTGGGGGGYRGGQSGSDLHGGGGGSNSVINVPSITIGGQTYSPSTSSGVQSGNGKARITLVKKTGVYYGELDCDVYNGSSPIGSIYLGDTEL